MLFLHTAAVLQHSFFFLLFLKSFQTLFPICLEDLWEAGDFEQLLALGEVFVGVCVVDVSPMVEIIIRGDGGGSGQGRRIHVFRIDLRQAFFQQTMFVENCERFV